MFLKLHVSLVLRDPRISYCDDTALLGWTRVDLPLDINSYELAVKYDGKRLLRNFRQLPRFLTDLMRAVSESFDETFEIVHVSWSRPCVLLITAKTGQLQTFRKREYKGNRMPEQTYDEAPNHEYFLAGYLPLTCTFYNREKSWECGHHILYYTLQ